MSNISFNPATTTSPQNTFLGQTNGYVQGTFQDDPTSRLWLAGGTVATGTTVPVYGGMALSEVVAPVNNDTTGSTLSVAPPIAGSINAWSVFNQGYNGIITPGNSVPQYPVGATLMYFRTGSNARIAVKADSTVIANAAGTPVSGTAWFWDTVLQTLTATSNANTVAFTGRVISVNTNSKVVVNTGGILTWAVGNCAIIQI